MTHYHSTNLLLNKLDLVALVKDYVRLTEIPGQRNHNFLGTCPFCCSGIHTFRVWVSREASPGEGLWRCELCNLAGNAVTFIMEFHKVGYHQALVKLHERFCIAMDTPRPELSNQELLQALNEQVIIAEQKLQAATDQFTIDNLLDRYNWLMDERAAFKKHHGLT